MKNLKLIAAMLVAGAGFGACDPGNPSGPGVDAGLPPPPPCPTWYQDSDGDHHGSPTASRVACAQPAGYVASHDDCNDADVLVNPLAPEVCDQIDNDCNPQTLETCPAGCEVKLRPDGSGHRYLFCTGPRTWDVAHLNCNSNGYRLARIDDNAEDVYVRDLAIAQFGAVNWWLGGSDAVTEGNWKWEDGAQFWMGRSTADPMPGGPVGGLYSNWSQIVFGSINVHQPDDGNTTGITEDCLGAGNAALPATGSWFDTSCTQSMSSVCERY